MTLKMSVPITEGRNAPDHEESPDAEVLRALIERRRLGRFVDLDEVEGEARAMLERKRILRAAI